MDAPALSEAAVIFAGKHPISRVGRPAIPFDKRFGANLYYLVGEARKGRGFMNGVHDLGGMHGLGHVDVEQDEPVFHTPWEKTIFGTMLATMGQGMYNLDEFRHGIEVMNPAHYLTSSYYEHWLETMEKNLIEKGVIDRDELDARTQDFLRRPEASIPPREDHELADYLMGLVRGGGSTRREVSARACSLWAAQACTSRSTENRMPRRFTISALPARRSRSRRLHGDFTSTR